MEDWIKEGDGNLAEERLGTFRGGDFNFLNIACYWTLERATAEQYRHCRKKSQPPLKYDEYRQNGKADLVKGHTCKSNSRVLTHVKKQEVQEQISEKNL